MRNTDQRMPRSSLKWLLILLATLGILAVAWAAARSTGSGSSPAAKPQAGLQTVSVPVEGMSCVACAANVKRAVGRLSGVSHVEVNLGDRTAIVTFAPAEISPERIAAGIDALGYRAGAPVAMR